MGLWTKETGFPLLSVLEEKREGGKVTLKLKQERYLSTGDLTKEEEERGVVMQIPLGILTEKGQGDSTLLFSVKEGTVDIDSAEDGFVKLNSGQTGFYRVKYTAAQLARLGQNLDKLDSTDRVGLVADAFALAQAGYSGTVEALDLVSYYGAENDYVVLSELASRLGQVGSAFYAEPAVVEGIKRIQRGVFARLVKELGFEYPEAEKGDHLKALMRTLAISQACKGDDVEWVWAWSGRVLVNIMVDAIEPTGRLPRRGGGSKSTRTPATPTPRRSTPTSAAWSFPPSSRTPPTSIPAAPSSPKSCRSTKTPTPPTSVWQPSRRSVR